MNRLCLLVLHLLILCVISCAPKSAEADEGTSILWNEVEIGPAKVTDVAFIPLETKDECLLGYINKILYRNGKYYILDRIQNNGVFIFDEAGHFLSSIVKPGEGPGEYIELMDMDVDLLGNVYVADNARMNIICYKQGNPKEYEVIPVGKHFKEFCCLNTNVFLLRDVFEAGQNVKLARFDKGSNTLTPLCKPLYDSVDELSVLQCSKHYLYRSGNRILYNERFTPYIYSLSPEGELEKMFTIASEDYVPEGTLKELEGNPQKFLQENRYIKDIISIYENDKYLVCMPFVAPSATYLLIPKSGDSPAKKVDLLKASRLQGISQIEGVVGNRFLALLNYSEELPAKVKQQLLPLLDKEPNPILALFAME